MTVEMGDLSAAVEGACLMDVKMGVRCYSEAELNNQALRPDLFERMMRMDSSALTAAEKEAKASADEEVAAMGAAEPQAAAGGGAPLARLDAEPPAPRLPPRDDVALGGYHGLKRCCRLCLRLTLQGSRATPLK